MQIYNFFDGFIVVRKKRVAQTKQRQYICKPIEEDKVQKLESCIADCNHEGALTNLSTIGFAAGFVLMMVMDVMLG